MTEEKNEQNEHFSGSKKDLLEALSRNMGNVTMSCRAANVGRTMYYQWQESDEEFKNRVQEIKDELLDFGENKFLTLVQKEVPSAVIHFAKTKLRKRGYGEVQQIEVHEPKPLSWLDEY